MRTPAEIRAALGGSAILIASSKPIVDNTQLLLDAYGVTESGNFEGKNILFVARDLDVLAAVHHTSIEEVEARLATARAKLFAARELADVMLEHFADPRGGFFDTSDDHKTLLTRPKNVQDNAVPSGSAMVVTVLLKLGAYCGESAYTDAAESALRIVQPALARAPTGFGQWLCALDFDLAPPKEIAIVGPHPQPPSTSSGQALSQGARGEEAGELLDVVIGEYRPNQVVAWKVDGAESVIPLLDYREARDGKATAYVCQNFACQMPVTDAEALAARYNQ